MPVTYPIEFKKAIMRRYQNGETLKLFSEEFHVSQSTLYHWRKEFCSIETPQHAYTSKEFDAISRKLEKLEHEKEIIQLSGFLEKVPLKTRLATLEELYKTDENHTAFMNCVKPSALPEALFITIFSSVPTEVRI